MDGKTDIFGISYNRIIAGALSQSNVCQTSFIDPYSCSEFDSY